MKQKEKLKTMATAMGGSMKRQSTGEYREKAVETLADMKQVEKIIAEWPESSKKAASHMIKKYGPPNEAIQSRLI
jgi:phosphosulfolactate synthase (CoM biosynthesis protein A)